MRFRLWQMTLQSKPLPITANLQDIVMETFTSSSRPMISAQLAYTLGACFDVSLLEERCRSFVVQFFEGFMRSSEYFNLLSIWCPGKTLRFGERWDDCSFFSTAAGVGSRESVDGRAHCEALQACFTLVFSS